MTATIPPTSAPPRRRADETPRTARRRAPETEGNRTDGRAVDKSVPKTARNRTGTDTDRARKPRAGAATPRRTAKAGPAAPDTRRTGKTPRTRGAGNARLAVPGTKRLERVRDLPGAGRTGKGRAAPVRSAPRARTPFVLLIVALLAGALVSLLLLNTVLAQDAFTLSELQSGNHQLGERKQALQEEIDRESSPEGLHARARSLGMRDVPRPAFIDARTGRIIEGGVRPPGVPDDAVAAAGATAVTGVPGAIVPPPRTGRTDGGTR